jgi:tetratricopeptide (TPR) repeat protein
MSQLVVTPHTVVDKIPLGRRIHEIMKEKGGYYSVTAMAGRLGICRETYRVMLKGEREIYTFELDKIAKDLKMPLERILQKDICKDGDTLKVLLEKQENPQKALELAQRLYEQSIGITERCLSLHRLGVAYFFNHSFDQSYHAVSEAHQLALKIKELYNENDILYRVLIDLTEVYTAKQDYVNASKILEMVEPLFHETPTRSAFLAYLHAKIEESLGNYEQAKHSTYESIKQAIASGKKALIGKTKVNAAHYEFLTKNYLKSKELLESAIEALTEDIRSQLIARKELAKTLLKLKEFQRAEEEIMSALEIAKQFEHTILEGKLFLLLARASDTPDHAEYVVSQEKFGKAVRYLACKFLMQFYRRIGDSNNFIRYYEIGEKLNPTNFEILDEGEM